MIDLEGLWDELSTRLVGLLVTQRKGLRSDQVRRKADGTLVTDADLAAEELILAVLATADPSSSVLTEERSCRLETGDMAGRLWIIDPIDGTSQFVDPRAREYCSVIALLEDGSPVACLVVAPELGRTGRPVVVRAEAAAGSVTVNRQPVASAPRTNSVSATRSSKAAPGRVERTAAHRDLDVKVRATSQTLDMVRACVDLEPETGLPAFRCFAATQQLLWDAAAGLTVAAAVGRPVCDQAGAPIGRLAGDLLALREPRIPSVLLGRPADLSWMTGAP